MCFLPTCTVTRHTCPTSPDTSSGSPGTWQKVLSTEVQTPFYGPTLAPVEPQGWESLLPFHKHRW